MLRISIATNFKEDYLKEIHKLNIRYKSTGRKISEIFGAFPYQLIGSARYGRDLPPVNKDGLKRHIALAHKLSLKFNFLLNAPCAGNIEYEKEGRKKIEEFLQNLQDFKVDIITVTIPYLIEIIREKLPNISINTSTICQIDSIDKAQFYERLGVQRITLPIELNRDFKMLKNIREKVKVDLELLANSWCLLKCPQTYYHHTISAHFSQKREDSPVYLPGDYCWEKCTQIRLQNPKEFIRSPWIRPEDLKEYADLGINYIKIAGREYGISSSYLLQRAEAYLSGEYRGNLADLIQFYIKSKLKPPLYYNIDNKKLDGFLNFFKEKEKSCRRGCGACSYCEEVAKQVVTFDKKLAQEYITHFKMDIKSSWELEDKIKGVNPIKLNSVNNVLLPKILNYLLSFYWFFQRLYFRKERKRFKTKLENN